MVLAILPDSIESSDLILLPHPRTGEAQLYAIEKSNKRVLEIVAFEDSVPRSLFVGDTVEQDGKIIMFNEMDALLLALPYLLSAADRGFLMLDQLLESDEHPNVAHLEKLVAFQPQDCVLRHVCDVKQGEPAFYRLNNEKLVRYLAAKAMKLDAALRKAKAATGSAVTSSRFVAVTSSAISDTDMLREAVGVLSDYLPKKCEELLRDFLGLEAPSSEKTQETGKYAGCEAVDDYTKLNTGNLAKKAKVGKLTPGQKSLSKVDKTGMKSIASFFGSAKKK